MRKTVSILFVVIFLLSFSACAKDTIKVTFDSQGGSDVSELEIEKGTKLSLPSDPTKSGYVFSGWYTNENGDGVQIIDGAFLTSSTTLYAYWSTGTVYEITFDPQNGGSFQTYKNIADTFITIPEEPKRDGYTFSGWFTAVNGQGDKLTTSTPATTEIVYYAYWSAAGSTNVPTGTTGSPDQLPAVYLEVCGGSPEYNPYVSINGKVDLPSPQREGYTFGGWFTARNGQGTQYTSSTKIDKDVRLYAYWATTTVEKETFKLTLYVDSDIYKTFTVEKNETQSLPKPSKSGYEFMGWYTGKNGKGDQITSSTKITENIDAFAFWKEVEKAETYTVTFHYNDGTDKTITKKVESGKAVSLPEISREGYTLTGWQTKDGTALSNSSSISNDLNVYAQWKQNEQKPPENPDVPEVPEVPEIPETPAD